MTFKLHNPLGKGGVVSSILTGGTTKPIIFKQFSGPGDSPVSTDIYGKKRKRVGEMWGRCGGDVPQVFPVPFKPPPRDPPSPWWMARVRRRGAPVAQPDTGLGDGAFPMASGV